jgi:hypothetical protein
VSQKTTTPFLTTSLRFSHSKLTASQQTSIEHLLGDSCCAMMRRKTWMPGGQRACRRRLNYANNKTCSIIHGESKYCLSLVTTKMWCENIFAIHDFLKVTSSANLLRLVTYIHTKLQLIYNFYGPLTSISDLSAACVLQVGNSWIT